MISLPVSVLASTRSAAPADGAMRISSPARHAAATTRHGGIRATGTRRPSAPLRPLEHHEQIAQFVRRDLIAGLRPVPAGGEECADAAARRLDHRQHLAHPVLPDVEIWLLADVKTGGGQNVSTQPLHTSERLFFAGSAG